MHRTIYCDSSKSQPFEIGAMLLAILAFPSGTEDKLCQDAKEALCADVVRATISADLKSAAEWRAAYPAYAGLDAKESRRRLRTFERRMRDRMVAARMALGFLEEGISGVPARLPFSMARHSINELSKLVASQSGQSDPENVERRTWRDTRPVIHLASAIQVLMRRRAPGPQPFGYRLDDAQLHGEVIELARFHEQKVLCDPRFGVRDEQLIRIRRGS